MFTDQTYDLAQTLLKAAVNGIVLDPRPENGTILYGPNGPLGAMFESAKAGITIVRHSINPKQADTLTPSILDENSNRVVQQKIVTILNERINQTV